MILKLKDVCIDFCYSLGLWQVYTKVTGTPVCAYAQDKPTKHEALQILKNKMETTPKKYWNVSSV